MPGPDSGSETRADAAEARPTEVLETQPRDLTGRTVDRYRVVREIGRGGMGVVYEARDDKLDRTVALKVLWVPAIDERARRRFLREARAAAALNHPRIVTLHDAGEADGMPFLVMEFVPGANLAQQPPRDLAEAVRIAAQICDALEHAHAQGIVHRDLKPGNVLVTRSDGAPEAKLTDLGIALARGAARVTRTGAMTGTPTYMAPEQAMGNDVDGRADLYALGVLLYEWAAGRPPFAGDDALAVVSQHIHAPVVPPRTFRRDLPAGLEPLILRLLAKEPDRRFSTAAEVREALARVGAEGAEVDRGAAEPEVTIEGLVRGRMVGRRDELGRLQAMWQTALGGRSHLALISGEPGVGKTRLAREMLATARLDGARVLTGGCYENEATTPYLPFVEALRRWVGDRDDAALRDTLGDSAAEMARLAPEIDSRLGPFDPLPPLSPQEERLRLFDHVARFLRRLAEPRGLLFFFDDLQWADHGSLALLHYLLRQLASERILLLGAYREVELDRSHPLAQTLVDWNRERLATRLALTRLTEDDTARMVGTLLGEEEVPVEFVRSLHRETEGNPFFIEEIVKALIAEGGLVRKDYRWQRRSGEIALPQSVKAAIGSRLSRIGETSTEVLRTAAVLGKQFEFEELAAVAACAEDALLDALDEAVAAQLIVAQRGEAFAFTHDKIREVLYEELNPVRRRRLHTRIAEGLETLVGCGCRVAVEDLAHHFVHSGDYEKGLRYAREAADAAARLFAFDEALEMLARARECAEALDRADEVVRVDEAMGDAAFGQGDVAAAAGHYQRALAAVEDPELRNALRCKIGETYVTSGDRRGLECVMRALDDLDAETHPMLRAHAMMTQARYLHLEAKLTEAAEIYQQALRLAEPTGDSDLLVRLYSYVSGTYQHLARFEESDSYARRCIEVGERENIPAGPLLGHEFLSENAFYRGWMKEAVSHGEQEEKLALQVHARERYAWSQFRAFALRALGRITEAEQLSRRAIAECRLIGERRAELFMRMLRAGCLLDLGRVDDAMRSAADVVREADEAGLIAHRLSGRHFVCAALLARGKVEEALMEARTALELWRTTGSRGMLLIYGSEFAEVLVRGGELDEAATVLDAHAELAEKTGANHRLATNLRARGMLAARAGKPEDALRAFDEAVVKLETQATPIEFARTLVERSKLHRDAGRTDHAEADAEAASRLVESCGAAALPG